ncbi:MAG: phospholipase D-like domain-containing protein [Prevotellaceae bacterium]|nr:phospholipase D-like domain-containing protein [Prevotellaceae bacterium]
MNNTLIDNSCDELLMVNKLKECFAIPNLTTVRIATGYWDIPGLALVAQELAQFLSRDGTRLLLLIGKDPYIYASQMKQPQYKDASYPLDFIRTDLHELEVNDEYQAAVSLLLDYCSASVDSKIQIRVFRKNENDETQFLHSKCYIFEGKNPEWGYGIVGSSNFTAKGLVDNAELNYLETDPLRVLTPAPIGNSKPHLVWFNERWETAEPWNETFLEQVLRPAPITKKVIKRKSEQQPFTPYELYIKLLQTQFGDIVDQSLARQIESYLPDGVSKLDYQIEAVKRCLSLMREHGGFMLADVVGLGKTIVGTLVIKRFLSIPDEDGREPQVLIITPPAIQAGWRKTVAQFDEQTEHKISPHIDYITTGSIGLLLDPNDADDDIDERDTGEFATELKQKNYGLIIIDESHRFRNSNTAMYRTLDELIEKIGCDTGVTPYVGLLSATPQNNRPNDLKNQIYLFERNHLESTLKKAKGGNLESFFADISHAYNEVIGRTNELTDLERRQRLEEISRELRECVLNDILERRTRTDVRLYYQKDMQEQGLFFPKIVGPNNLEYVMDDELARLFYDTMSVIAPSEEDRQQTGEYLEYYRYRAIEYFADPANERKHTGRGNRGVREVTVQLAKIMQIMLVKRLESSFTAFRTSLLNLRRYTENMIRMWDNDTIFVCPQIDVNAELDTEAKGKAQGKKVSFDDCVEDLRAKIQKLNETQKNERGQNAEYTRAAFRPEYLQLLKSDRQIISDLCDRWARNSEDPKFDTFKESLNPILFNPETNTSRKLVIFSEAIDTVQTLARATEKKNHKALVVTAATRDRLERTIEENFDANYTGEWRNDYDVLITTEVLAEGVNLHRANVILNYDTPWNSTRLMQRIGRVNRIGSKEPRVYVYNFMPSAQGDHEIQLVRRAYTKLQSFHTLFGEDSKIFSEEESLVHYDLQKAVEGEESPMQKYVQELKDYKAAHPERYTQIEQAAEGWEMAQAMAGNAYFLVKAERSARLAICLGEADSEPANISLPELMQRLKTPEDTPKLPLPDDWQTLRKRALTEYNQYFVRVNKARAGDRLTQALNVIVELFKCEGLSQESKQLLRSASRIVRRGNHDLINKMIAIGNALAEKKQQGQLETLTNEVIDDILRRGIAQLVRNVEQRQGEAAVLLATLK